MSESAETLTPQQARFVEEYLVDLNATQAAIRAGYSARTAYSQGQRLLKHVEVAKAIKAAMDARSERVSVTADDVLRELWSIATADANDLIEYRRGCCRHCWGEGHRYQFTEGEMQTRRASYDAKRDDAHSETWDADGLFDEKGGIGFNATHDPNPDCPECFGEGFGEAVVKDTRLLTGAARSLYAGVKVTKDGFEVKMHDKGAALVSVGRHLGMFTDKTEHSGGTNGALTVTYVTAEHGPPPPPSEGDYETPA